MSKIIEDQGSGLSATRQPGILAAGCITYSLAVTAVVLRLVARKLKGVGFWWDDYLIIAALASATTFFALTIRWLQIGLGLHYQTLGQDYSEVSRNFFIYLFFIDILYSITTALAKLSFLSFFWRIFSVPSIRLPIKILATCVVCWLIGRIIGTTLHCIPVNAYWDKTPGAKCGVDDAKFFVSTNVVNFTMDILILTLPIPYIKRLQMKLTQKIGLISIFVLGGFICISSILLIVAGGTLNDQDPDVTWTISPVLLWAGIEINLGVVSANLPSLRPIFTLLRGHHVPSVRETKSFHQDSYLGGKTAASVLSSKNRATRSYGRRDSDSTHPFNPIEEASDNNIPLDVRKPLPIAIRDAGLAGRDAQTMDGGIRVQNDVHIDVTSYPAHVVRLPPML